MISNEEYKKRIYPGIYPEGICKYSAKCKKCKKCAENRGHQFYHAKIGECYGDGTYPKILFVGKEAKRGRDDVESPQKISDADANNRHYLGLYYTAVTLFTGKAPKSDKQEDLEKYEGFEKYYCLTNYFKCAFKDNEKKVRGIKTNSEMKKHCPELLAKEIDLLRPDIIIVQGKFTSEAFWGDNGTLFDVVDSYEEVCKKGKIELSKYKYKDNNKYLYIVWGYHPASGKWYSTLEDFKEILAKIPDTEFNGKVKCSM